MKKICIITHSHLCRNPRVVKEAGSLSRAGYDVTILTTWTDAKMLEEDLTLIDTKRIKYIAGENIIPGQSSGANSFISRLKRRIATEAVRRFRIENIHALGYSFGKNLRKAIAIKADLYICHQELPTVIGCKLIRKGFNVAFDFEDWYSHDLLPEARKSRPLGLLEKYEKFALKKGFLSYTTSEALAGRLARFASSAKPGVLYNAFPFSERNSLDGLKKDRLDPEKVSFHWFSQTLGPGRGIEELSQAVNRLEHPYELHFRGNCSPSYRELILSLFQTGNGREVFIHPLVSHRELLSRIGEHDIGLALEKSDPPSRDLTITNKILQYLQGGLAVLASDTSGQKEVAGLAAESVFTFRNNDSADLAAKLDLLIRDRQKLETAKKKALEVTRDVFCWEVEEKKLLSWINNIDVLKS
jgi:glycosyltransferase involved in cell wall biosynthesis